MVKNKRKVLTIHTQLAGFKKLYPLGEVKIENRTILHWTGNLQSSPNGGVYKVKLTYGLHLVPKICVIDPAALKLAEGKEKLPHVYDHTKQELCLFYPDGKEWNSSKSIAQTIMPWAIEWLYNYELWLITGKWLGGGVEHE